MNFCPSTYMLLEAITSGDHLEFKANKIGTIYPAGPEHTLLVSEGAEELRSTSKFRNTLKIAAYNPVNPREYIPGGCSKCHRTIVSYQRLGEEKRATYSCLCGHTWA